MREFQRGIPVWWKEKRTLEARGLSSNPSPVTPGCVAVGTAFSDPPKAQCSHLQMGLL